MFLSAGAGRQGFLRRYRFMIKRNRPKTGIAAVASGGNFLILAV